MPHRTSTLSPDPAAGFGARLRRTATEFTRGWRQFWQGYWQSAHSC